MYLGIVERELIQSAPYFHAISPELPSILRGQAARAARIGLVAIRTSLQLRKVKRGEKDASDVVGELIAAQAMRKVLSPVRTRITAVHIHVRTPRVRYQLDAKNPYVYKDADGNELFRVRRAYGRFVQEHPTPSGWKPGRNSTPDVLYRLPELLQRKNEPVYIVEGEKDVNRLQEAGFLATTNPAGAGKWRDEHSYHLSDRDVIILPDNDKVGHHHATQVAKSAAPHARSVKIIHLPGTGNKEDIYDWLDQGNTIDDLRELVKQAPTIH